MLPEDLVLQFEWRDQGHGQSQVKFLRTGCHQAFPPPLQEHGAKGWRGSQRADKPLWRAVFQE